MPSVSARRDSLRRLYPTLLQRCQSLNRLRRNKSAPNKSLQRTRCFLRFSGHPELTVQECSRCRSQDLERRTDYSNEFKATAVRLSELPGVAVQDVAASLYIHPFMLSRWRKHAREGRIVTKDVKVDREVAAELKELRKIKKAYRAAEDRA